MVIIDHGRVVLAGDLAGLRAAAPERLVDIRYRGTAPDWSRLASAELVAARPGQARLRVAPDCDLSAVVAAASCSGIVSFAYHPPTLSELFRQAVAA